MGLSLKGVNKEEKTAMVIIGYTMLMRSNKAEKRCPLSPVPCCLKLARVIWLCACTR